MAISEQTFSVMQRIKFEWTSSTAGVISDTTTESYDGLVYRVIVAPGSSNSAPAAGYDLTLDDADDYDVLDGLLTDSSTSTVAQFGVSTGGVTYTPITAVSSKLTLSSTNSGNTKTGTVIVYIR